MIRIKRKNLLFSLIYLAVIFIFQHTTVANPLPSSNRVTQSYEINIEQWFDNKAFGDNANFDDTGTFFSGNMDTSHLSVNYNTNRAQKYDNVKANGQIISLNNTQLGALYMLVSASHGPSTVGVNIVYKDGTKDTTTLSLPDWQDKFIDQMDRYQAIQYPISIDGRQGALFSVPIFINPTKIPDHLMLPLHADGYETMHIFSVTAYESSNTIIISVQSTDEWINHTDQIILVKIHNISPFWIKNASVQVNHVNIKTVKQGFVEAVAPGHVQMVQVTVQKFRQQKDVNVTVLTIYNENGMTMTKETIEFLTLESSPNQYEATTTYVTKNIIFISHVLSEFYF